MVEDAKAARNRRLAEALRANLKRRKVAKVTQSRAAESQSSAETPAERPQPAEGDD